MSYPKKKKAGLKEEIVGMGNCLAGLYQVMLLILARFGGHQNLIILVLCYQSFFMS